MEKRIEDGRALVDCTIETTSQRGDVIGIGGMAIVYRAEQLSLGREVALKRDLGGEQRARDVAVDEDRQAAGTARDAALRAQYRKLQESLIAPATAAEEHAAELAQGPEAAIGDDPLGVVEGETHGTDADAGDYLIQGDGEE